MSKRNRVHKQFSIYSSQTTYYLPLVILAMYIAVLLLSSLFVYKFLIIRFDPSVFVLLFLLLSPWAYVTYRLWKEELLKRIFLRFKVNPEGIHCFGFCWNDFLIEWDKIHTYGIITYPNVINSQRLILFSTNPKERAPRDTVEANLISSERIIIQYRDDVWESLSECMPNDMLVNLIAALEKKQTCFYKR